MTTFTKTTALIITALFISANMFAKGFEMETEAYVDDIPFNTELIANQALYSQAIAVEFSMEEEAYIDDIPFNTDSLAAVALSDFAFAEDFDMEEEDYIDDIPFNTSSVVRQHTVNNSNLIAKN